MALISEHPTDWIRLMELIFLCLSLEGQLSYLLISVYSEAWERTDEFPISYCPRFFSGFLQVSSHSELVSYKEFLHGYVWSLTKSSRGPSLNDESGPSGCLEPGTYFPLILVCASHYFCTKRRSPNPFFLSIWYPFHYSTTSEGHLSLVSPSPSTFQNVPPGDSFFIYKKLRPPLPRVTDSRNKCPLRY